MNCKVANNEPSKPSIIGCLRYKINFPFGKLLNQRTNEVRIYIDQGFFQGGGRSIHPLGFALSPLENFVLHVN